jgi:hypothetical protein
MGEQRLVLDRGVREPDDERGQERTAALQIASREAGGNLQLSEPAEVAARFPVMRENPDAQVGGFDWVWGYDVDRAFADG